MFKKVVVGISGGVDSAVSALLLKTKGFEVTGVFMKNWDIINEFGECQAEKDFQDADYVCKKIGIPLHTVEFIKEYWNDVFSYTLAGYQEGRTPNPDIQCNKQIKFNAFFKHAIEKLGADAVATGHYARTKFGPYLENFKLNSNNSLLRAKDMKKDQTLFLSQVPQNSLRRTMLPLGDSLKEEVKQMAREANLERIVAKRESMGICFIGKRSFKCFMNEVPGTDHPAMITDFVMSEDAHWITHEPEQLRNRVTFNCDYLSQHRDPVMPCTVYKTSKNQLLIRLRRPIRSVTPGQFAVLYSGEECLGSSEICYTGPSYYMLNKFVIDATNVKRRSKVAGNY